MLLLYLPILPPAPSRPRHRARSRPLTNTPTYLRKPPRAASAGEGCAMAVTLAACGMVAPLQYQPSAGPEQSLCGAREVEEAPCCFCVRGVWCACARPRPTLEPITLAHAALIAGIVPVGQAGPTPPPRRPPGGMLTCSRAHVSHVASFTCWFWGWLVGGWVCVRLTAGRASQRPPPPAQRRARVHATRHGRRRGLAART